MSTAVEADPRAVLAELRQTSQDADLAATVQRRRLHAAIVDAVDVQGLTVREVARALHLSSARVYKIIETTYRKG